MRLYIHSLSPQSPQEPRVPQVLQGVSQPEEGGPLAPLQSLPEDMLPDSFSMLPHFADLSTVLIQQVIKFAKEIPAFRSAWLGSHTPRSGEGGSWGQAAHTLPGWRGSGKQELRP